MELADGGFILDEVHRLTSEGQEKLFTVLDKGYFTRWAKPKTKKCIDKIYFCNNRSSQSTFFENVLRRIPVTLAIPALAERSLKEKFN